MCRKRLDGGLERGRVLRLGNYEGNLPIHPSAGMKERRRKKKSGRNDLIYILGRTAHNTGGDVSYR